MRQLTPSTQKSMLPWASVQTTAQPAAMASRGGRQKPSCCEVCTNTVASLRRRLTSASVGRIDVGQVREAVARVGLRAVQPQLGRGGVAQPLPRLDGEVEVLDPVPAADGHDEVVAALGVVELAEDLEVDAGRDDLGVEGELAQAVAVPRARGHGGELLAVGGEHAAVVDSGRGSTRSRCPARTRTAMPRAALREPHRQRRVPPRGDLDRVERGELLQQRLVAVEAAHRDAQVEPVGRVVERVQGAVVAARGQAVEVLEHDAMPAAHAGVLGHVGDAQLALGRAHVPALEPVAPAVPERVGAGCIGRARRRQLGHGDRGEVVDAQADLPRAQRPVDRRPRHGQRVVERAHAVDARHGAGTGRRRGRR